MTDPFAASVPSLNVLAQIIIISSAGPSLHPPLCCPEFCSVTFIISQCLSSCSSSSSFAKMEVPCFHKNISLFISFLIPPHV